MEEGAEFCSNEDEFSQPGSILASSCATVVQPSGQQATSGGSFGVDAGEGGQMLSDQDALAAFDHLKAGGDLNLANFPLGSQAEIADYFTGFQGEGDGGGQVLLSPPEASQLQTHLGDPLQGGDGQVSSGVPPGAPYDLQPLQSLLGCGHACPNAVPPSSFHGVFVNPFGSQGANDRASMWSTLGLADGVDHIWVVACLPQGLRALCRPRLQ